MNLRKTNTSGRRDLLRAAIGVLAAGALFAAGASGASAQDAGKGETTVKIIMSWYAQASQGGYWAMDLNQYAAAKGVKFEVSPGGPAANSMVQVASGKFDMGIIGADDVLMANKEGTDLVVVFGGFDVNPRCLMSHEGVQLNSVEDMKGHLVAVNPGLTWWMLAQRTYDLKDVQQVSPTGGIGAFLKDPAMMQQCLIDNEPATAEDQGVKVNVKLIRDLMDYNPYYQVLFTTRAYLEAHPDAVQAAVAAAEQGWTDFLANPKPVVDHMLKANPNLDVAQSLKAAEIYKSDGFFTAPVGRMAPERWEQIRDRVVAGGLLPADYDVTKAYTTRFLGK